MKQRKGMKLDLSLLKKLGNPDASGDSSFCLIFDEICVELAQHVVQHVIEQNLCENPPKMMNFLINSPGGSLTDAFAIIDVMQSSSIPIRTIGLGQIASAGLMIFLAGQERVLTPNTSILSHRWSGGSIGKEHELFAIAKEFDLTSKRMLNHYVKCTGLSEKDVKKYLLPPEDVYLSAEDALKYKLCDRVALIS